MPFPDEDGPVRIVAHRPEWADEFTAIATVVAPAVAAAQGMIDHVGSTAVPGLPAKDVIDVQIRVAHLDDGGLATGLARLGYGCRAEPWNRDETTAGETAPKLVFAGPVGGRRRNIHVRRSGGAGARAALLFRDYLTARPEPRPRWGAFRTELAGAMDDLGVYGRIKAGPWALLMELAESRATATGWEPDAGR